MPTKLPPIEGQQKETEYPGWHKETMDTMGKDCEGEKIMWLTETLKILLYIY